MGKVSKRVAIGGLVLAIALAVAYQLRPKAGLLETIQPRDGVKVASDIAYGPDPRQTLDVYAPTDRAGGHPTVVFIYGGDWRSGSRASIKWLGRSLARLGYVVVVPDYRIHPQVVWPAFLQDSAAAVRWARDHAAQYGGDPRDLFLAGHSSGAYNVAMLALDPRWLAEQGMQPDRDVRGVVGLSGFFNPNQPFGNRTHPAFGALARLPEILPRNHARAGAPPMLLTQGMLDREVSGKEIKALADAIKAKGGEVVLLRYWTLDHNGMLRALSEPFDWTASTRKDVAAFIDSHAARTPKPQTGH